MNKLKLYSIKKQLLCETITNWEILFSETKQSINNYLKEVSKWHNFDYLESNEAFEYLPSDCYSELLFKIIDLWYPFYFNLYRGLQEEIESDIKMILFEIIFDNS
jgi:hypothetical protein